MGSDTKITVGVASYYVYFVANRFNVLNYKLQSKCKTLQQAVFIASKSTPCASQYNVPHPFKLKLRHRATVQAFKRFKTNAWTTLTLWLIQWMGLVGTRLNL